MSNPENPFILNLSREGEKVRVRAFERTADEEQTLKHYEDNPVSIADIENLCKDIVNILHKAKRRGDVSPELMKDLKKAGQALFDEILTPKAKKALRSTASSDLLLHIDDQLVEVPFELFFDGEEFLCLKFSMGRIVSTRQRSLAAKRKRKVRTSFKMLIIADPQGNLKEAYKEGIKIRDELGEEEDKIKVNLMSSNVDTQQIKNNIRDYDVIHYAGHADYNCENSSESGWIMSNKKWTSFDISKMAGGTPLPSLVFSNACHSGRTDNWHVKEGFEKKIFGLANAFLLSGVRHYIGTFWEILDSPGSAFAVEFYKALSKNVSVGEAVRTARKKLIDQFGEGNIIWASYMLYGDPTYKIFQGKKIVSSKEDKRPIEVKEKPVSVENHARIMNPSESSRDGLQYKTQRFNSKLIYGAGALLTLLTILIYTEYFKTKPTVYTTPEVSKPAQEVQQTILLDRKGFKKINNLILQKDGGKRINKDDPTSKSLSNLISKGEKAFGNLLLSRGPGTVNESRIAKRMNGIKKNLILAENRGSEGLPVYKKAAQAVVLIVTNKETDSGSILDRNRRILTNYHVVQGFERVAIFFKPEKGIELKKVMAYAANVVKVDEISDLAILKIENPPENLPTLKLATMETVEVAQDVYAVGHPGGEIWTYTKSTIEQIIPNYKWTYNGKILHKSKVIQTKTPINKLALFLPVSSGGPLLNDKAEILGINSFTKRGEGLNFAVPVDVIKKFLERKGDSIVEKPKIPDALKNLIYFKYDLNKDGIVDAVGTDLDENGKVDMYIVNLNQDTEVDYVADDKNENGKIEAKGYDTNKSGNYDKWFYDTNEDGINDLDGIDTDENGVIDKYLEP